MDSIGNLALFTLKPSQYFIGALHPLIIPFDSKLSDESPSFIQSESFTFSRRIHYPHEALQCFPEAKHNGSAIIPKPILST